MHRRKWKIMLMAVIAALTMPAAVFAIDAEDGADEDSRRAEQVQQQMGAGRAKSPGIILKDTVESQIPKPTLPEGKTAIKEVRITGATILAPEEIASLKASLENKELNAKQMQRAADRISRAYSREGYITSYAYIVPDKLGQGVLEIMVVEGRTGKISFEGNNHYSEKLLRRKITLKEGDVFNFKKLNEDVFKVNKHPDRKLSMVLDPNVSTGYTDVAFTVKDRSPFHVTLAADNYGSQYILYKRYKTYFTYNNLTGNDDSLTMKLQATEANAHKLIDFDYFIPLNNTWKFNLYYMPYKNEDYYYADNEDTDFEKHAHKWYFWFIQSLVNKPDLEFTSSYGFVSKDIHWYQRGERQKSDMFRALMWGLDFNRADRFGRWVVSNDVEWGIPRMFGGSTYEDNFTSVQGAGGGYKKNHLVVARRQKLVHDIDLLAKAHWQLSNQSLTGVNVFSVGGFMGVIDNRGFPRAQAPGDRGQSLTLGLSAPPFGVPRGLTVPYSKTKWYDAVRVFTFIDWADAILKSPTPEQEKHNKFTSGGVGAEFKVPDRALSMRLDIAWPLSHQDPKDGDNHHVLWSVTKGF